MPLVCAPVAALVVFLVQAGRRTGGLLAAVRQMGLGRRAGAAEGATAAGPAAEAAAAADGGLWGAGVTTWDVFVMVMQMLLFLSYTMVNNMVMSVFKCRELDAGYRVLAMEVSVRCDTPEHRTAVAVGLATVVLITAGVPLQAYALMRLARDRLDEPSSAVRYGFFFQNYRRQVYWYECFSLFRKAALVAVVVMFEDRLGVQVFSVSLISTVFLTMHTYHKPYTLSALNNLETFALFVSTVTLSSCSFFYGTRYAGSIDRTYEACLSWAIILLSAGLVAASAALVGRDLRRNLRGRGESAPAAAGHRALLRLPVSAGDFGGVGASAEGLEAGTKSGGSWGSMGGEAGGFWDMYGEADGGRGGEGSASVHENPLLGAAAGVPPRVNGRERTSVSNPLAAGGGAAAAAAAAGWGSEFRLR